MTSSMRRPGRPGLSARSLAYLGQLLGRCGTADAELGTALVTVSVAFRADGAAAHCATGSADRSRCSAHRSMLGFHGLGDEAV